MDLFIAKTDRIKHLYSVLPKGVEDMKQVVDKKSNIYLDFGNIFNWYERLNWHIDVKRLKQFLDSFPNINKVKLYNGKIDGDPISTEIIDCAKSCGCEVITKPVKAIELKMDVSGIPKNDPAILKTFIKKSLLDKFSLETVEYLNEKLGELNKQGILKFSIYKCNFDVEISIDIITDLINNDAENFILWTGDSDFAEVINRLQKAGKSIIIFNTSRRITAELANTKAKIFDIKKIKEFICWKRELDPSLLNAKGTSEEAPKPTIS